MKKLHIILAVILLAACKEKPKPMAFSNDTNKVVIHGFYYDSTTNTLRTYSDTTKLSTNVSPSRIITRGGKSPAWFGIKPESTDNKRRMNKLFNNPVLYSSGAKTVSKEFPVFVDTIYHDVSLVGDMLIAPLPKDSFIHTGSIKNSIFITDTQYTKYYHVIIEGEHGYAAYQKCDTCRLVVLDSAATINTLFYHLMRQYKITQSQLK